MAQQNAGLQSLLRWSIENANHEQLAQQGQAQTNRPAPQPIDPGIIDMILGKPDAVRMRELLELAQDESKDEDERIEALESFEMLIEQIDNANDITNMKMWEPLLALLDDPSSEIQFQILWILGTAVQNNPKAQSALLAFEPLPRVLRFLQPPSVAGTRSKAVYCLSQLLRHSKAAVEALETNKGWPIIKEALTDSDISVRRKLAFLLNSLLIPVPDVPTSDTSIPTRQAFSRYGIAAVLIDSLITGKHVPTGVDGDEGVDEVDADYAEKAARCLSTYLQEESKSQGDDTKWGELKKALQGAGGEGKWGLTAEEVKSVIDLCG